MTDLFKEILPSIMKTKKICLTVDNEKSYVPFVINRALSYHYDCIEAANMMNLYPDAPKLAQYHYHINKIRARERKFQKWQKNVIPDDLRVVMTYYKVSSEKARDMLRLLSSEQIHSLRKKVDPGGIR